ncbi:MAG: peptidylprolyl isomerase [Pseudomarimonas sp.]
MSLVKSGQRVKLGMRRGPATCLLLAVLPVPLFAQALLPPELPQDVVAKRGNIELSLKDVDVKIRTMPPELRAGYLTESDRAARFIDSVLLAKQVAARARELGIDKEPGYLEELELAATELLSRTLIERHTAEAPIPNVSNLARERYLADPAAFTPAARIDLSHVLVPTDRLGESAAKTMADDAMRRAQAGESFADVVAALGHSDVTTESMASVDLSKLDPAFARAVGQLEKEGDIVGPVRTRFGYHIVRLDLFKKYPIPPYDQIEAELIAQLEGEARDKAKRDFLASFSRLPVELNDKAISGMRTRYLGGEAQSPNPPQPAIESSKP